MPSSKKRMSPKSRAPKAPLIVPTQSNGTKNSGPTAVPVVSLNPRRRYTAVLTADAPYNGVLDWALPLASILSQIKSGTSIVLNGDHPEYLGPWRSCRLVSASFWGAPQPVTTVPFSVHLRNLSGTLPPPPYLSDSSTGSNDRPFVKFDMPATAWKNTSGLGVAADAIADVKGIQIAHILMEVW